MADLKWPHTGAVLAGGKSIRFGSPKHNLILSDGGTFLESAIGRLGQVCQEVVVVGSVESGLRNIPDLRAGLGPLGGIEALLASGWDTDYLVCPVDMPLIPAGLLRRLTESTGTPVTILGIEGSDHMETLPVRIASSVLPQISAALDAGRGALYEMWAQLGPDRVVMSSEEASYLFNVNTPDDYRRLEMRNLS